MKHHKIAITGIVLTQIAFFGLPAIAAESVTAETVDTGSTEWNDCLTLLRLSADIADRGTYRMRMAECVNEQLRSKEVGDVDREHRLSLRAKQVMEAFQSGRLSATTRSVDTRVFRNSNYQRVNNTEVTSQATTSATNATHRTAHSRPSRRSIQDGAYSQSIADKKAESALYQQRWQAALESCKQLSSHFHRNNCIRKHLRQAGLR